MWSVVEKSIEERCVQNFLELFVIILLDLVGSSAFEYINSYSFKNWFTDFGLV